MEVSGGLLPFTAHRVEMAPGVWTIQEDGVDPLADPTTLVTLDTFGGRVEGKRVLDVGCLEGGYTVAFARHGAREAVGIEVREANLVRCRYLRDSLRLPNLTFIRGDAKTLSPAGLGRFDIVFASGLLYHLDDPYDFIRTCHELVSDLLVLDTHVAATHAFGHACAPRLSAREWGDKTYVGREAFEYDPSLGPDELEKLLWTSYGNPTSFWLTEASLVAMLWDVGFPYVSKVFLPRPFKCQEGCSWECRIVLLARRQWQRSQAHESGARHSSRRQ